MSTKGVWTAIGAGCLFVVLLASSGSLAPVVLCLGFIGLMTYLLAHFGPTMWRWTQEGGPGAASHGSHFGPVRAMSKRPAEPDDPLTHDERVRWDKIVRLNTPWTSSDPDQVSDAA